jgi:hypothetical protein
MADEKTAAAEGSAPEDRSNTQSAEPQILSETTTATIVQATVAAVPSSGTRQSFRNIARQLNTEEMCHPGVVKLIIENLDRAEEECEQLRSYQEKFHAADVERNILREQLKTSRALDVAFAVMIGLGCAVIGLTPTFWDASDRGPLALALGLAMVVAGVGVRIAKR